jgi:hypothetical protein
MTAVPTRPEPRRSVPTSAQISALEDRTPLAHAVRLIYRVCCLAGHLMLIEEARSSDGIDIRSAIDRGDTPVLFDWLMEALSYQGISDQVAAGYIEQHGNATWANVPANLGQGPTCPKLGSYWAFHGCRYDKLSRTCAEPDHIEGCPLPTHDLRNGRLNQTAYSLFLFVRDICDGDLVGWIDNQLQTAADAASPGQPSRMTASLIEAMRHIYGVSDKVLAMALSSMLLGAPRSRPLWRKAGAHMIAIDSLVHNFLHRTGILHRFQADHAYGPACYQPHGCAEIIGAVSLQIDARQFSPAFPKLFPRFVQNAIWRYCAQRGLDVCNGNRIDDTEKCSNVYCQIFGICDRLPLK